MLSTKLQTVLAVAEYKNFTRAAEELNMTQLRRASRMRRALLGPMPGTRSSISKGARFTSTGNSP